MEARAWQGVLVLAARCRGHMIAEFLCQRLCSVVVIPMSKARVKLFEWLGVGHDGEASLGRAKSNRGVSLQGVALLMSETLDVVRPHEF